MMGRSGKWVLVAIAVTLVLGTVVASPATGSPVCGSEVQTNDFYRAGDTWYTSDTSAGGIDRHDLDWDTSVPVKAKVGGLGELSWKGSHRYKSLDGFTGGPDGDWWVLINDTYLFRTAPQDDWDKVHRLEQFEGDREPNDLVVTRNRIWVVTPDHVFGIDRESGSTVTERRIGKLATGMAGADDELWITFENGTVLGLGVTGDGGLENIETRRNAIRWELENPQDLYRTSTGQWWVLAGGGGVAKYTDSWEHTGESYGQLDFDEEICSRDSSVPVALQLVLVALVGVLGPIPLSGSVGWRTRTGVAFTASTAAVFLYVFALPSVLSPVYALPDRPFGLALAVGVPTLTAAVALASDDLSATDAAVLVLLTAPLALVGVLYALPLA